MMRYALIAVGLFFVSPNAMAQTKLMAVPDAELAVACPMELVHAMDAEELIETNDLGATLADLDLTDAEINDAMARIEVADAQQAAALADNEAVRELSAVRLPMPRWCWCPGGWVHIQLTRTWIERRHEDLCSGRTVCGQGYDCTYDAAYRCQRTLHIWWCPTTGRYYVYSGPKFCRAISCTQPTCN